MAGNYQITYNYRGYTSGIGAAGGIKLRRNNTDLLNMGLSTDANAGPCSYVRRINLATGSNTFDIQFNETSIGTARLFDSSIEVKRIL